MKEIAQQILNGPFNWTGLTLRELVDAERIPSDSLGRIFRDLATNYLSEKYRGENPIVKQYLAEKEDLEFHLEKEFFVDFFGK